MFFSKTYTKTRIKIIFHNSCQFIPFYFNSLVYWKKTFEEPPRNEQERAWQNLRYFYAEARTRGGALYSRSSLLGLRNAIERYLNNPPFNRGISITKGTEFQSSNKLLQSMIKLNKRENNENTKHKPPIPAADLQKLKSSNTIRGDSPWGLLQNVWLNISLYWCRRGREGQRQLTKQSF